MRATAILGALAAVLLTAAPAHAAQFTGDAAAWAQRVQAHVHMPGPAGPTITITFGPCPDLPDAAGCALPQDSQVYLATRDRFVLEHELGHIFDAQNLNDAERTELLGDLGFDAATPWENMQRWTDGDPFCAHSVCPDERFADFYAACALAAVPYHYASHGGQWEAIAGNWDPGDWSPSRGRYAQLCRSIRAAAPAD